MNAVYLTNMFINIFNVYFEFELLNLFVSNDCTNNKVNVYI